MAQTADNTLEQRIADLESSVRALVAVAAVGGPPSPPPTRPR
jgi:hypothetical protein